MTVGSEQDMAKFEPLRSISKTLLRWTARLVLLAFALAVAGTLVVTVVLPRATHGAALTVLTGSMTPKIPVGSVVVVRPADPRTLRAGDVATYQVAPSKDEFITHRIIKIDRSTSPATFTFKGDANPGADLKPVPAGAIRGKVWFHVPYIGAIRDALHGKGGISLIAMLVLAGYALSQLSGAFQDRKKRPRAGEAQPDPMPVVIGRPIVLACFSIENLARDHGMTPEEAAPRWAALVLQSNGDRCTLLIAPAPDGVLAATELLDGYQPISLQTFHAPVLSDQRLDTSALALPAVTASEMKEVDVATG